MTERQIQQVLGRHRRFGRIGRAVLWVNLGVWVLLGLLAVVEAGLNAELSAYPAIRKTYVYLVFIFGPILIFVGEANRRKLPPEHRPKFWSSGS